MSKEPKRNSDINSLSAKFRKKFDARWAEVIKKYPDARVFEARRSLERQKRLYAQGRTRPGNIVTRTLKSRHLDGDAVDIVFYDDRRTNWYDNKPTRFWPYDDLIEMAKKYGIRNLKPKETCHFEDDWSVYNPLTVEQQETIREALANNSKVYHITKDENLKKQLHQTNSLMRSLYGIK